MLNNYDSEAISEFVKSDLNESNVEVLINAFSYYLSAYNQDFVYNRTYLPSYIKDFIKFGKYIKEKKERISKIISQIDIKYHDNNLWKHMKLVFDDSWEYVNGNIYDKFSNISLISKKEFTLVVRYEVNNSNVKYEADYFQSESDAEIVEWIEEFIHTYSKGVAQNESVG